MALVLTGAGLELHRLGWLNATRPQGLIRSIPYGRISDVVARTRRLELVVTVIADDGPLEFATAKRGGGSETVEDLRRRIAA
jgi:hypothetical protein